MYGRDGLVGFGLGWDVRWGEVRLHAENELGRRSGRKIYRDGAMCWRADMGSRFIARLGLGLRWCMGISVSQLINWHKLFSFALGVDWVWIGWKEGQYEGRWWAGGVWSLRSRLRCIGGGWRSGVVLESDVEGFEIRGLDAVECTFLHF